MPSRAVICVAALASAGLCVVAASASACVALASLELSDTAARPADQVGFRGAYYHDAQPVELRLGSLDGPLLATVDPPTLADFGHSFWREIAGTFTIPGDTEPGTHVVLATQRHASDKPTWGVPARAALEVVAEGASATPGPVGLPTSGVPRLEGLQVRGGGPHRVGLVLAGSTGAALGALAMLAMGCRRNGGPSAADEA